MIGGLLIGVGASCADIHRDGVWTQAAFAHHVSRCAPSFEVGWREGGWSVGWARIAEVESDSPGTVLDTDYDPGTRTCLAHCDMPARFVGKGRVDGIFFRYAFSIGAGFAAEVGGLINKPQWQVTVSGWREGGLASSPIMPTVTYRSDSNVHLSPSLALTYAAGNMTAAARIYAGVKTTGTWPNSIYSGIVGQLTTSYTF